jgi:hypothetical protein
MAFERVKEQALEVFDECKVVKDKQRKKERKRESLSVIASLQLPLQLPWQCLDTNRCC